ncbi:MAG: hypothetical protein HC860_04710 [Alkalinema sp. RU_4_3]|nr:hypothetical protein [Alkalinema sp. RU_4_3]
MRPFKQTFTMVLASLLLWCSSLGLAPSAAALTPIKLTNPTYRACPAEMAEGIVSSRNSQAAKCFLITATAENSSGKTVYDADVFGRIYDANGDTVFENRGRVGTVDEIPAGSSEIEIRITVSASQPEPLMLKQFKATGFATQIRK